MRRVLHDVLDGRGDVGVRVRTAVRASVERSTDEQGRVTEVNEMMENLGALFSGGSPMRKALLDLNFDVSDDLSHSNPTERLRAVMAKLRDPDGGCPWDVEQTFATIAPYTIEEAYEVADAIQRGDMAALKDELGDLLLQVFFHARMAEEDGQFDFDAVAG